MTVLLSKYYTQIEEYYTLAVRILHSKIFIKVYLIENKEVTLLIQLNW